MENASGRNTLANSIKTSLRNLVLRPQSMVFSRPFALIFMLYGGTYLTANTLDSATSTVQSADSLGDEWLSTRASKPSRYPRKSRPAPYSR